LKVEYFSLVECQLVLTALYDFYEKQRIAPSLPTLELYLTDTIMPSGLITWTQEDMPSICKLLGHIHSVTVLEPAFYQEKMKRFVEEVQVHDLMREAQGQGFGNQSQLMLEGLDRIRRETSNRGGFEMDSASDGDPGLIITQAEEVRIPTGLHLLDTHLSGGLAPTEVGMVTACTGVGKSNTLTNFTLSAIVSGWRALLITTELPVAKMKRRYQAMATGITANYFKEAVENWPNEVIQSYQYFLRQEYKWRGMEMFVDCSKREYGTAEIEQAIVQWKDWTKERYGAEEAAKCKLVCIDWLDYISTAGLGISNNARSDEHLTVIPKQLGFIGRRTDTAIWTATQGTREADGKEVLQLKHTSGAYHKNDALDVSIGLGRVNDDANYGDVQEHWEVQNEDSDESPPCDRDLVISLMKGRESAKAGSVSFKVYQGPSLRFWNSKHQMKTCDKLSPEQAHLYPQYLEEAMGIRNRRVIV
jgi:hypothetical protein